MIIPGVSCIHPILIKVPNGDREQAITVGCGHCISCKMKRTREWTLRLIMESRCWPSDSIAFVTLTYDNDNLPLVGVGDLKQPTLVHRDIQLFFKRLRRRLKYNIKMFTVGEYGLRTGRSHYHSVLYGISPRDWHFINECWNHGFVLVKSFYNETAGYVAGYIQKKLFGKSEYGLAKPPYLACSQHLGEQYFWDNAEDICKKGYIMIKNYKYPIPRIFARKAVERGLLPAPDIEEIALLQNLAVDEYIKWTDRNNIEISDYERNYALIQSHHFKRQNLTRDLNEEV